MNWLKCLPFTLLWIRTRPRSDIGISPYERMFGLPFLLTLYSTGHHLKGEMTTWRYLETIGKTLEILRKKGYPPQTSPPDIDVHQISLGDWVLIKSWNNTPLTPKFKGPFQVLLTTCTTVWMQERGWTHITQVKRSDSRIDLAVSSKNPHEWVAIPSPSILRVTFKRKPKVG